MEVEETEESGKPQSTSLNIDLNPEYSAIQWEIVGKEPTVPVFDSMIVSVEKAHDTNTEQFIQGLVVEAADSGDRVLFDPTRATEKRDPRAGQIGDEEQGEEDLIRLSKTEYEDLLERVRSEAAAEAESRLREQLQSELMLVQKEWEAVFGDVKNQLKVCTETIELQMISVAVDVMRHFLRELSPGHEPLLRKIVGEALEMVDPSSIIELCVSPEDFALAERIPQLKELQEKYGFVLKAEASVKNGCILRTEFEELDFDVVASFDRAFKEIIGDRG